MQRVTAEGVNYSCLEREGKHTEKRDILFGLETCLRGCFVLFLKKKWKQHSEKREFYKIIGVSWETMRNLIYGKGQREFGNEAQDRF